MTRKICIKKIINKNLLALSTVLNGKVQKKNYVFKKGSLGVGYYLDKKVSFEKVDVR